MSADSNTMAGGRPLVVVSFGFRPFFLGVALWAAVSAPIWLAVTAGAMEVPSVFDPFACHAQAFLFDDPGAAVAALIDVSFLALPVLFLSREIVAVRNGRNLIAVGLLDVCVAANAAVVARHGAGLWPEAARVLHRASGGLWFCACAGFVFLHAAKLLRPRTSR